MMRTIIIGEANTIQRRMYDAAAEALTACENAIRPGAPMGEVFEAHSEVFNAHGFSHAKLQACGYGMGAVYNPIWVEFPMFYQGNPLLMRLNQVFFLHMILVDSATGLAMTLGHSVLVTDSGAERLSRHKLQLLEA
jgi:Xaa-Pro dipeptidase